MSAGRAELIHRTSASDANAAGDVHGGWILKLLDDAAVIAATRHCRTRVVTAAVDGVRFRHPVQPGDVLRFRASVNAVWRTSMEVGVRVEAENTRLAAPADLHELRALLSAGRPSAVA